MRQGPEKQNRKGERTIKLTIAGVVLSVLFFLFPPFVPANQAKADKVVVVKSSRLLMLLKDGELMKVYRIALGKQPKGPKMRIGDQKTPEGTYVLDSRKANSKFHLAIHISYPNSADLANAQNLGVAAGNGIMIHGLPRKLAEVGRFHRRFDWTDGCIAVTNEEMEEIWQLVPDGTPIEIRP